MAITHYSSDHGILLVGEGDFSFSLSLALSFASACNIVATSLDTYDELMEKYKSAGLNIQVLRMLGAQVFHGVDATKMKLLPELRMHKFDRIIFNFPHAGFHGKEDDPKLIRAHSKLVQGFFRNASAMLRPFGEVHVNHKTSKPYCHWNIKGLAKSSSLAFLYEVRFRIEDYPWYNNKRGDGKRADDPFHLGECNTFKFTLDPHLQREQILEIHNSLPRHQHYEADLIKLQHHHQPTSVHVMSDTVGGYNGGVFNHRLPANNAPPIAPDSVPQAPPPLWSYFGRAATTGGGTLLDIDDQQRLSEHRQRMQESLWRMRVRLYGQHPGVA